MGSLDRNRADHLDRLVDVPTAAAPADLRPLADLAADLRRSLSPAAEPARRGQVWARLAPRLEAVRTAPRPRWRPALRPAYALASLAAVLVLGLGTTTAFASTAALPGDALYPVKRGLEAAELALSRDDAALTAAFADRRLAEIESLSALGRWTDIEAVLGVYEQEVEGLSVSEAESVESQLERHVEVLERVRSQAPEPAQAGLDRAIEQAERGRRQAQERRGEKGPRPQPPGQERREEQAPESSETPHVPQRPGGLPPGWEKRATPTP
ncbi:MAG: hypothetical protein HW375_601 [Anaerolineales bacterium]|nr:hypothetical protein [Anaerolineales bacterium]